MSTEVRIDYSTPAIRAMEALRFACDATFLPKHAYMDHVFACQLIASNPGVTRWLFMLRESGIEIVPEHQSETDFTWKYHLTNTHDRVVLCYNDATRTMDMWSASGEFDKLYYNWHTRDNMTDRIRQDIESAERMHERRELESGNVNLSSDVKVTLNMYSSGVLHVDIECKVVTKSGAEHTVYLNRHYAYDEDKTVSLSTVTKFMDDYCSYPSSQYRRDYQGGFTNITTAVAIESAVDGMTLAKLSELTGMTFFIPSAL